MEVQFSPEQEAQLSQIAKHSGTDAVHLVKNAALRLLQSDDLFLQAVEEGIAASERGDLIEEEEMDARIERMLKS
jgi:predicted transcriptional regulator